MTNNREGMKKLVSVAMDAKKLCDTMDALGYEETPYHAIFFGLSDAVYEMIGEHTETFYESKTYQALYHGGLTDEQRIEVLLG